MRNFHTVLMLSQGIPMLHMGDEYGHTKKGNNNTWCQDNELSWFLWDQLDRRNDFFRFYRLMNAFRKKHLILKHTSFLTDQDIEWHGSLPGTPNWDVHDCLIAFTLKCRNSNEAIYAAFNAHDYDQEINIPACPSENSWLWVVNTANNSPFDIYEHPENYPLKNHNIQLRAHSAIVLIANTE